jgi:protein with PEP-CTERM/exosortase system signal
MCDIPEMKRALTLYASATALFAVGALAVPLNITVDNAGNPLNGTGVASKYQYGQQNNNPTSNRAFLNSEISLWNGSINNPHLLPAIGPVALNDENLSSSSYTAVAGYDYVVFHFGAGVAGGEDPGGWWQAFHLDGIGDTFDDVPKVGGWSVGDFSSARYYNPHASVPDGGTTAMLLGLAISGMAVASRILRRCQRLSRWS